MCQNKHVPFLQLGGHEHNTNSVEASETMSTNSASSPIPYMHNHSNDTSNDISEKRRHKSSSDDSKVSFKVKLVKYLV